MSVSGWIGVDLDGTLAEYRGRNNGKVGVPVPTMVSRVKAWLSEGVTVKIMTARVGTSCGYSLESGRSDDMQLVNEQREIIKAWCVEHVGQELPITASKDFPMIELWDDRAVQVVMNTGARVDGRA